LHLINLHSYIQLLSGYCPIHSNKYKYEILFGDMNNPQSLCKHLNTHVEIGKNLFNRFEDLIKRKNTNQ